MEGEGLVLSSKSLQDTCSDLSAPYDERRSQYSSVYLYILYIVYLIYIRFFNISSLNVLDNKDAQTQICKYKILLKSRHEPK